MVGVLHLAVTLWTPPNVVCGRTPLNSCKSLSDEEKQKKEMELTMQQGFHWTFWMMSSLRNALQKSEQEYQREHFKFVKGCLNFCYGLFNR